MTTEDVPKKGAQPPSASPGEGGAVAVPDLEALKSKIDGISGQIRDLKNAGGDDSKDKVPPLVAELLKLKKEYADNNGGIGVDGKPYEPPMSKAEKKKLEKAKKKAAAEAAGSGAGAGEQKEGGGAGEPSKGAQKKAAKKAAAKAKKEAMKAAKKEGGGVGGGAPPAAAGKDAPAKAAPVKAAPKAAAGPPVNLAARTASRLRPGQLSFNPNASLPDRPVVALAVAVLLNGVADVQIVSDHTRHGGPAYGLPNGGGELGGDLAIARYFARTMTDGGGCVADGASSLLGEGGNGSAEERGSIEQWVDYALTVSKFGLARRVRAVGSTLNAALATRTYVVGARLTLADLALYSALGFPSQLADAAEVTSLIGDENAPAVRWMNMLSAHPAVREATQLAVGVSNDAEAVFEPGAALDPLVEGMNPLAGATPGSVVTRFPPEPSGYLHIGHAKALLLNDYYARRYKGRLIARFDDTNPSKEKEEFQSSILEDLGKLGVKPDVVTYTSDYFETIKGYAERMIREGTAYMDDTPQEQMQKERLERKESARRDQSPQEAMEHFKRMCSGKEEGAKWCLRARIDMSSVNGTMRDPVVYRQNLTPHHRSGKTYKAYPTYDLACPIVDSLEGVTHALRTTEYNDRDEQYGWFQRALGLRRVRIHAFSRVNFMNTVLSKRKLTWFVDKGHVAGWDDPRFPTVRGVVRRGIDVEALRQFMCAQGASRRIVNMEWGKFWAENKRHIDVYAKRFMAIDKAENVKLTVTNGPDADAREYLSADYHPKDPTMGKRIVRLAKEVLLEKVDADSLVVGEDIVLMRWGVVKITKVKGGLEGEHCPDGDFKAARKKLSWIADVPENTPTVLTEFDNLITKEKLEEDDNFEDYINPHTKAETEVIGDAMLRTLAEHDVIQLERRGYYRVDRPYVGPDKPLVLFMVPDGKAKPMSGLAGQLKHS